MRHILAVTMAITLCAGSGHTWAQDAASKAAAEQLFQEGKTLMQQARYEEAIAKFQASLDLDPGSGTQGNIAFCYEKMGKLASAWGHYQDTVVRAEREGNTQRAQVARTRATALEPRLPRLRIRLTANHDLDGLIVRRDGVPVPATVLGTTVYIDPGEHEVMAHAPGYQPFATRVTLFEAEERTIEIPALTPMPEPPMRTDPPAASPTGATAGPGDAPGNGPTGSNEPRDEPGRAQRRAAWITGGAGLAVLTVGIGIGAAAISTWDDAFASGACNADTLVCTPQGQEQTETARSRARWSNVLVGTGIAAVAAGTVLYFTAPRPEQERATTRLVPFTAEDTIGVAVMGGF
ncbi:MAG TPA: tetratricopeptide repeat protein [Haliangium sp.]|nr:tetratricopeptide repeat protein [Haliangium sp.]